MISIVSKDENLMARKLMFKVFLYLKVQDKRSHSKKKKKCIGLKLTKVFIVATNSTLYEIIVAEKYISNELL